VYIRLPKRKNCIRPSKNRIEFERMLYQLGYRDNSPIFPEKGKEKRQINYYCQDGSAMAVYLFLILYATKKSYVYPVFLKLKKENESKIKEKLHILMQCIYFEERTRIVDVGWEAKYTKQPDQYCMQDRTKIVFDVFKQIVEALSQGMCGKTPQPGDILAAKPHGPKINDGFNETSIAIGTHQRYLVAKRVGFGPLYGNGFCYARYDENCVLRPI
jgi:hypothetical protein